MLDGSNCSYSKPHFLLLTTWFIRTLLTMLKEDLIFIRVQKSYLNYQIFIREHKSYLNCHIFIRVHKSYLNCHIFKRVQKSYLNYLGESNKTFNHYRYVYLSYCVFLNICGSILWGSLWISLAVYLIISEYIAMLM